MNQKLPVVRPRQLVRALERAGFFVHHQTGSHARLLHKTRAELRVTVPIHSKDIPPMGYLVDSSSHYILGVGVPALVASTIVL